MSEALTLPQAKLVIDTLTECSKLRVELSRERQKRAELVSAIRSWVHGKRIGLILGDVRSSIAGTRPVTPRSHIAECDIHGRSRHVR
jgi:hypothetical protein